MTDEIRIYNTKSRELEIFVPARASGAAVGVYSCGPTVYHYQHLGNMRAAVFADTLHRTLLYAGYEVRHIINITDVGHLVSDGDTGEDKLERGARREGKTAWEVATFYTDAYFRDLDALNIAIEEYLFPRATDHIEDQIRLILALEKKGYTYRILDGVYFDTSRFERYPDFARLDVDGLKSGARIGENSEKRNVTDFALWKFSPSDEKRQMEWESPWGTGFPGWHVECSAMAMKYLGSPIDIHTGGIEHIPVHHTNEIAQSECATGTPFAKYWMHNNHLLDPTGKMSKSNDEFLTLSTLVEKGYAPAAYRYFLMSASYRKELLFSFEALDGARNAYDKLISFCQEHATTLGYVHDGYREQFKAAMYDDLNTSKALGVLWTLLRDASVSDADKYATLLHFDTVFGFGLDKIRNESVPLSKEMQALLSAREDARKKRDFEEADRLRDEMSKLGFIVKDTPDGQQVSS